MSVPLHPSLLSKSTGERGWIAALRRRVQASDRLSQPSAGRSSLRLGIGDDCAILRPGAGQEIVLTTDLFLEQVHFRRDWHTPEAVGHRCLARGLSDIAAMGAQPTAALLSIALPAELSGAWSRRFQDGLLALADLHKVELAGGDTAEAPKIKGRRGRGAAASFSADIVLVGRVPQGRALLRSGARVGDLVYVTGSLGGAAAELAQLARSPDAFSHLVRSAEGHPHLFPQPRIAQAARLRSLAGSAIDLSDGLSTDLAHLCEESGVAAEITSARLPIHPLAAAAEAAGGRGSKTALELALHGGEDYELLFTARPGRKIPASIARVPITCIGSILPRARGRSTVTLIDHLGKRRPLANRGWQHFDQ